MLSLEKVLQKKCFWQVCNFLADALVQNALCIYLTGIQIILFISLDLFGGKKIKVIIF